MWLEPLNAKLIVKIKQENINSFYYSFQPSLSLSLGW